MGEPEVYQKANSKGVHTPGWDCANCGHAAFEHEKERVQHEDGRYSYDLRCP